MASSAARYALFAAVFWSVAMGISFVWQARLAHEHTTTLTIATARATFDKDQAYRRWASDHGGVYVPPTARTPPSPYLAHIPDRDVVTTDGKRLTLMNPAYMLRQMMDEYGELYGIRGRIVGIVALNPNNIADPWETAAIRAFEAGTKERMEFTVQDGAPVLRLMRPMLMREDCMKCHGHLGFKVGDVRGGVGVSVPLEPYLALEREALGLSGLAHGGIWLLGLAGIGVVGRRGYQRDCERRRHLEELRVAADVFESSLDAMLITDHDRRIIRVNLAFTRLTGYEAPEAIGQTPDLLMDGAHDPAPTQGTDTTLAAGGRWQGEVRIRRKGGEAFAALENIVAVPGIGGAVAYYIDAFADITERKQAEADREARRAAEAASRAKSEFLSAMSHELRTPLNAILGYAQILARGPGLSEQQAAGLTTIQQSGQHLLTLINDLLDLAKIEAGKFDLDPVPTQPAAFLAVVADIIRVKVEEKSLLFRCDLPKELPAGLLVDEKRLRQVLLNLLGNAVKFTDRGTVSLAVVPLGAEEGRARLRFEVSDTGIGLTPTQLALLFRPFEQVGDTQRRAGGTGLGLAISRQLVRLMGGDIQVESRAGEGSRFRFELALPLAQAVLPARAAGHAITGYDGPRRTLLIADDVVGNRAMLGDLLHGLGFELCEAQDGAEAVEQVRRQRPDLVLMDLVMPVMDGIEAIRHIRASPDLARLPIIVVSASANQQDQAAALAAGADGFLPKPIDQSRLLEVIGERLGLSWSYAPKAAAQPAVSRKATLAVPPPAELVTLREAALDGDMRAVREQAERLAALDPLYASFAERLLALAKEYQSQAILDLVAGPSEETPP